MTVAVGFVLAAGLGAVIRWWCTERLGRPWGTVAVNIAGSYLLGWASSLGAPAITVVGVAGLGTLTTFSTFVADADDGGHRVAAVVTVVGGVAAAWLGLRT